MEPARAAQRLVEGVGRLVAASTTTLSDFSKSRPPSSAAVRRGFVSAAGVPGETAVATADAEGIDSSMNTIAVARTGCSKRSRTRAAPTPTNISTKVEPEMEEGDMSLTGDHAGEQGLPGPGRPGHQHATRAAGPGPW